MSGAKPTMTTAEEALWEQRIKSGRVFPGRGKRRLCECNHTGSSHHIFYNAVQVGKRGGKYPCASCGCLQYRDRVIP